MAKTVEDLESELASANQELVTARARISELNRESQGHRLNADKFRGQVEGLEAKVTEAEGKLTTATTGHTAALEALRTEHNTALTALRTEHTTALDGLRTELGAKVTAAEGKVTEVTGNAKARATQSDLRIAAKDAGMVDLDGLKLLDSKAIKTDDDGNVTNGAELMATLKTAKPFLFGTGSTSSTSQTPPAKQPGEVKSALKMTDEEYKAGRAAAMAGNLPPVGATPGA